MQSRKRRFSYVHYAVMAAVLLAAPLVGVVYRGLPLGAFVEFPLRTGLVVHAPFSWPVFAGISLFATAVCLPFVRRYWSFGRKQVMANSTLAPLPWWGWPGGLLIGVFWILAWNRFAFFEGLQRFTFFPLWFGFILLVNGLTCARKRSCLLRSRPFFFWSLFAASAFFWWYFEYLNRFVQNWYYLPGIEISQVEYALHATVSFSTVLPAVLAATEFLGTMPRLNSAFADWRAIRFPLPGIIGSVFIIGSTSTLACLVVFPDYLFPLVWIAPLLVIIGFQLILRRRSALLDGLAKGDWRPVVLPALAALICGFLWELWNWKSLAHWEYSIPFVDRFHLFAMPLPGYAGYLPFGLECFAVASLLYAEFHRDSDEPLSALLFAAAAIPSEGQVQGEDA